MPVHVRPFHRNDRDQVTALVNAHVAAVLPGATLSVQQVLSQLEREPREYIVDPWVVDRVTLVAEQRGRVVAAAHLLRYGDPTRSAPRTGTWARFAGCCTGPRPVSGRTRRPRVRSSCARASGSWSVGGSASATPTPPCPCRAVYGVPEQWPHVTELYRAAGFTDPRVETVFLADVADLPSAAAAPPGVTLRRLLGANGTRFAAVRGTDVIGYLEVDTTLDPGSRLSRLGQWADVGNMHVAPGEDPGLHAWLLGQAADWLRLAGVTRLLDYANPETPPSYVEVLLAHGFHELTRVARGWRLAPGGGGRTG